MFRFAWFGALLLLGCPDKSPVASTVPALPHGFRAPTLKCVLEAPSGWTASNSPMPDHILELIATAPKLQGRMVVREAAEGTIATVTEEQKQRTLNAWGKQPDFQLLREDPLGAGRLLAYQWRRKPSAPVERHLVAVLPMDSKVLLAMIDDDGATPENHLLGTLGTLKCTATLAAPSTLPNP